MSIHLEIDDLRMEPSAVSYQQLAISSQLSAVSYQRGVIPAKAGIQDFGFPCALSH